MKLVVDPVRGNGYPSGMIDPRKRKLALLVIVLLWGIVLLVQPFSRSSST